MEYYYDKEEEAHTFHWNANSTTTITFGGENRDGVHDFDAYGISFGDNLTIYSIPSAEFKSLALQMINQLMRNGHEFSFVKTPLDGISLRAF
jgi:hypothetical protein